MIELKGKCNTAKVFTDNIESEAINQIIELCNQEFIKDSKIRIMPDTHAGAGCTIGTTMTLNGKVVPNLVSYDIGCGMFTVKLLDKEIDLSVLDTVIREYIPAGQTIRKFNHRYNQYIPLNNLKCIQNVNIDRAMKSVGTLGGGNHFIELSKDSKGNLYLIIHTGSRYLGKQIAEYYQKKAIENITKNNIDKKKNEIINKLKSEGKEKEIQQALKDIKPINIPSELCYLEGKDYKDYLHDMHIAQSYARINREAIADIIIDKMKLKEATCFHTTHNYIDENFKIDNEYVLRKGAIRALKDEKVLIPINMKDGSILAKGKGNPDWNYSAPHGAGRLLSRSKAKEQLSLEAFKESMKDIYTTSVNLSTLDEAPMAYKPMDEILSNIKDTVEIIDILKPIYNFKAS